MNRRIQTLRHESLGNLRCPGGLYRHCLKMGSWYLLSALCSLRIKQSFIRAGLKQITGRGVFVCDRGAATAPGVSGGEGQGEGEYQAAHEPFLLWHGEYPLFQLFLLVDDPFHGCVNRTGEHPSAAGFSRRSRLKGWGVDAKGDKAKKAGKAGPREVLREGGDVRVLPPGFYLSANANVAVIIFVFCAITKEGAGIEPDRRARPEVRAS